MCNLIFAGIIYDRTVSNDSVEFKHHSCEIEKAWSSARDFSPMKVIHPDESHITSYVQYP